MNLTRTKFFALTLLASGMLVPAVLIHAAPDLTGPAPAASANAALAHAAPAPATPALAGPALAAPDLAGPTLATSTHTTLRAPGDLLKRVGFDQRLGTQVPQDLAFRDAHGVLTRLGESAGGRPTLLAVGYYGCTNLCDAVRAGIAQAVEKSGFAVGTQFNVTLVSIDPRDTPAQALAAQNSDSQAHPGGQVARWRYLTGSAAAAMLARAVGFRYFFDPRNGQYAHTAGIVLLSPLGKVTQYLFGVQFAPETVRLGLVQAAQGRIGTIVDRLLLLCCDYDPSTGRYSLLIHRVMQGLGLGTAALLVGLIVGLRHRERRRDARG